MVVLQKYFWIFVCFQLLHNVIISFSIVQGDEWSHALPFTKKLYHTNPEMTGRDVVILQNLLKRHPGIKLTATGSFDLPTKVALITFQKYYKLNPADGILDANSALQVLKHLMSDGYKDDGTVPKYAKFKIYIPVYRDRNIETTGILFSNTGEILHKFTARTRGSTGNRGQVINQLTTNGNTPTGLSYMDVNSKEPNPKSFGPYPVLRAVKGIKGNSAIGRDNYTAIDGPDTFLSNYRVGILIHTGEWPDWHKGEDMPNSNGCIHVSPEDQEILINILVNTCGCIVNENPFGVLPYPYKSQGIISIEQLD